MTLQGNAALALAIAICASAPAGVLAQATDLASAGSLPVSVISASSGLSLFVRRGERYNVRYEHLCDAPCELSLEPGRYIFGVSTDGFTVAAEVDPVLLNGASILELGVRTARRRRAWSWTVFIVGMLGGTALTMAAILRNHVNVPLLTIGSVLTTAGLFAIIPAATAKDSAWVHVSARR